MAVETDSIDINAPSSACLDCWACEQLLGEVKDNQKRWGPASQMSIECTPANAERVIAAASAYHSGKNGHQRHWVPDISGVTPPENCPYKRK